MRFKERSGRKYVREKKMRENVHEKVQSGWEIKQKARQNVIMRECVCDKER